MRPKIAAAADPTSETTVRWGRPQHHQKHLSAWEDDLKSPIVVALRSVSIVLADECGATEDGSEVDHQWLLAHAAVALTGLLEDVDTFVWRLEEGLVPGVGERREETSP